MNIGKIISISELNVKILLEEEVKVSIKEILETTVDGVKYRFEVVSIDEDVVTAIPFDSVITYLSTNYTNKKGKILTIFRRILKKVSKFCCKTK